MLWLIDSEKLLSCMKCSLTYDDAINLLNEISKIATNLDAGDVRNEEGERSTCDLVIDDILEEQHYHEEEPREKRKRKSSKKCIREECLEDSG